MIARTGAARLTPFATGRDNRGALIITGKSLLPWRVATLSGSSAKARGMPYLLRALVYLRDGLTPTMH